MADVMKTKDNARPKLFNARYVAGVAMLSAIAFILMYIEIVIPIMPSFIKFDFSDLPAVIGAFAYGPLAGVIIELLKNLIHLPFTGSAMIGELSNFILGASFVFVTGLIYKFKKTKSGALVAGLAGSIVMGAVSVVTNFFIIYPMYYSVLKFPEEAVLGMYQAILPSMKNIMQCLLVFNLPFTIVKGLISVIITMFVYKPLSPLLHGRER
ncbi:MAG: ECF transporter S component [Lachnospiraceae bacterium]|nr:ECF transporter S component [Lachnospiraceae bacterium]